jgi:archaemetzincin
MKDMIKLIIGVVVVFKLTVMTLSGEIKISDTITNTLNFKSMVDGDTIQIQGMGNFNQSTLLQTKKVIEETYGVPTKIVNPVVVSSDCYTNGMVDIYHCLKQFDDNQNKIIVTNDKCYSTKNDKVVGGLGETYGNILIISSKKNSLTFKSVIIHEIGHNQGLSHCDNPNCVMYESIKDGEHKDFCDECKKSL